MEQGFQDYYDDDSFGKTLDMMVITYGKPLEIEYKMDQGGWKDAMGGYSKPVRKFWYASRTSTYEKGKVFITVEVVPDGDQLAGTSIQMVTFPLGDLPDALK